MSDSKPNNDNLPPIWNIRSARCREFEGREDSMESLGQILAEDHICILEPPRQDMPGIGISTLALEYAYTRAADYQVVWWIDAEHLASMNIEFAQLGRALDMIDQIEEKKFYTAEEIKKRLAKYQGWLLIFDNVPDPNLIPPILPEGSEGNVIITTSQPARHSDLPSLSIRALDTDSATETVSEGPLMGNLLALNILKAYHAKTGQPVEDMINTIHRDLDERSETSSGQAMRTMLRYPLSLLNKEYPASKDFLALCSFLSPNDIPLSIFDKAEGILTPRLIEAVSDEDAFQELLLPLIQFNLLNLDENALSMHPAVQTAVREGMGDKPFMAWCNASVKLINRAFPFESQYDKPISTCTRLIPHVLHTTSIAEDRGVALEFVSTLLYHAGLYIHAHRLLEDAQMCYLRSINIAERILGTVHQTIATRVNNLGIVEHELGNLDNAQTCFERAMEICETIYGPTREAMYTDIDDNMLTMPLRNLCSVLEEKGDVKRAQRAFEKAMKTFVDVYGWNHSVVAECAHNFGNAWLKLDKPSKAQNCLIKAVRAEENADDCDNAALAHHLNSLGVVLLKNNNAGLAAEQVARALRLDQKEFGEQHINIARDLINLGHAYKQLGRGEDAEAVYMDALKNLENQDEDYRDEHAAVLLNLGVVKIGDVDYKAARKYLQQSLDMHIDVYGDDSPRIVSAQVNLGKALDGLDASSDAKVLYERALVILKTRDPENHGDHATILYRLGRSFEIDKDYAESLKFYEQALNLDTEHSGQNHPNVARDAYGMASVLIRKGDTIVAMGHLTLALDIYERTVGKSHSKTRAVRKKLDEITH